MRNALLPAENRDHLGVRVDPDPEAPVVEVRHSRAELVGAAVRRILVRARAARSAGERLDHRLRRRQVGVADAEADHVDAGLLPLLDLALELGEEVGRNGVEPLREPHSSLASDS